MTWKELSVILNSIDEKLKREYENIRLIIHSIYQVNSTKEIKLTDIFKFSWDKEEIITVTNLISLDKATELVNKL